MVDLLVGLHAGESLGVHCVVGPHEVPFLAGAILAYFESQHFLDYLFDDGVSRVYVEASLPERLTNS